MKALFITNPKDLTAAIPGGVQLCSAEFLQVIRLLSAEVVIFEVDVSRKPVYRFLRKAGLDSYRLYDFSTYKNELAAVIENHNIDVVFVNKAELIRVSALIKRCFKDRVKVVVLSHGNESGDYLHQIAKTNQPPSFFKLFFQKLRLGLNLYTESYYRRSFTDLVCCLSEEELAIEKWLGAKQAFFIPRIIYLQPLPWKPKPGRVGFAGTLNHKPNRDAVVRICETLSDCNPDITLVLVGSPEKEGKALAAQYPFVSYLGALSDADLKLEAACWMYFLNPVFWYSRGASMKLGQALNWGLPVISTLAGTRGYQLPQGCLEITANDGAAFTRALQLHAHDLSKALALRHQLLQMENTLTGAEVAAKLKHVLKNL